MKSTRIASLVVSLGALSFMGLGCGPSIKDQISDKIGQNIAENMVNQASNGQVKADVSNGQMVFKDAKTGQMVAFGDNLTLPDDFPKDLPVYAGTKVVAVTVSKESEHRSTATLKSTDSVQKVMQWYADQMKSGGFTEESNMSVSGSEIRSYSKDKVKVFLSVSADGSENNATIISLTRTEGDGQ